MTSEGWELVCPGLTVCLTEPKNHFLTPRCLPILENPVPRAMALTASYLLLRDLSNRAGCGKSFESNAMRYSLRGLWAWGRKRRRLQSLPSPKSEAGPSVSRGNSHSLAFHPVCGVGCSLPERWPAVGRAILAQPVSRPLRQRDALFSDSACALGSLQQLISAFEGSSDVG